MTSMPPPGSEIARTGPTTADPLTAQPGTGLRRDNALVGIGLVLASTVFFALSDVTAKHLTGTLPAIQVAWLRFLVFCVLVIPLAAVTGGGRNPFATAYPWVQAIRGLAMVGSAVFFVSGLAHLPIADATAISFVAPIFITGLSVWALGELVGVRRWTASVIGLIGVVMIVRPGSTAFQPAALFPIASAAVWACTVVMTRRMSTTERPATTLAWSALLGFLLLSAVVPFQWVTPSFRHVALGIAIGLAATIGQWLMILAYANANASVLAPFSYAQLVWATLLGVALFGAVPGAWTLAGAAVITASGLYIAYRERIRARALPQTR